MGAAWCSRGRPPRIVLKPGRPEAIRAFARFLTADVGDEETAAGLSELPVLLYQAMGFVMRSGIAARGFNHGLTRIHTDPVLWCVVPSDPHERGNHE